MSDLMLVKESKTMDSREIAELTGKEHKNICRDIREMIDSLHTAAIKNQDSGAPEYNRSNRDQYKYLKPSTFEKIVEHFKDGSDLSHHPYPGITAEIDARGYISAYHLDRSTTYTLITGYRVDIRQAVIDRWMELEQADKKKAPTGNELIALAVIEAQRMIAELDQQLAIVAPKAVAFDTFIRSDRQLSITDAAKHFGVCQKAAFTALRAHDYLTKENIPTARAVRENIMSLRQAQAGFRSDGSPRYRTQAVIEGEQLQAFGERIKKYVQAVAS